jgi:putative ABC transport system permease protein
MDALINDVRYALVTMRRNPGFTAAGLLTLAVGIGATTAVFSVVYGVLLRPLPYPNADRLVRVSEEHAGAVSPLRTPMLSNVTYYAWSRSPRTIDTIAASSFRQYTVALPDGASRIDGSNVTPTLLPLIGAAPALGRFFNPDEGREGANAVLVLSDRLWRERFNADLSIVGRGLIVDDKPYVVIGVARPGFYFPDKDTLMWTPMDVLQPAPDAVAGGRGRVGVVTAWARLAAGVTTAQAAAEATTAARTAVRPMAMNLLFGVGGPVVVHVRGVVDEMTARVRPALVVLAAAALFVLLIACANVANLFLSRGIARQRELSVRAAIGASRARLGRQLLTESAVLSAIGGTLGLGLAWGLVRLAPAFAAKDFPRLDDVRVDGRVLLFAIGVSVFTMIAAGLAPAVRGARFDLAESLHGGDGASAGGFRGARAKLLRDLLLMAEASFAVMLLVGATLLARSFVLLTHVDAGYTAAHVLTAQLSVPGGDSEPNADRVAQLVAAALDRARAEPGVIAAGIGNMMPLDNSASIAGFLMPGHLGETKPKLARALQYVVTPGYAEALGLRLRAGRLFTDADLAGGVRPWIVNEEFARLYLPPRPVGFQFPWKVNATSYTVEIVGVIGNVLKNGNDSQPQPELYLVPRDGARFLKHFEMAVRTTGDPAAFAPALRQMFRDLAPSAAIETTTLGQRVAESVEQPRFAMTVLVVFAVLALALASVGLYGVLSYGVAQRRRELGVRAALGAGRSRLMGMVLREGLLRTGGGLAIGLVASAALTRLMQGVLFGVTPLDPIAFAAAPAVLLPVAIAACLIPARRAARVSPSEALRAE